MPPSLPESLAVSMDTFSFWQQQCIAAVTDHQLLSILCSFVTNCCKRNMGKAVNCLWFGFGFFLFGCVFFLPLCCFLVQTAKLT